MIDINKFIASLLQWGHLGIPKDAICFALKEQGLEFRDGSIKDILEDAVVDSNEDGLIADTIKQGEQKPKRMVSAEAKEAMYDKPAWSEEDETMATNIIIMLKEGANLHFNKNDIAKGVDWLKSLRPQSQWKPSEEQMKALDEARSLANNCGEESAFDLRTLYEQLKKLREE